MKSNLSLKTLCLGLVFTGLGTFAQAETYTWKTVRVGGGGATTSIQAHPKVQNLFFITTDVGTPYRWNNSTQHWEGMFYKNPATQWANRGAAARLAFDPSDATGNTLYATTGGGWSVDGTILKSTDRGDTWTDCEVLLDVSPNSEQGAGQRLAVDPQNSNVIYVTTRANKKEPGKETETNGTFKSAKAGEKGSWAKINNICGNFVQFDPSGGMIDGVTKRIYIGNAEGVYLSTDGGATFTLMPGSPAKANKIALHSSGTLYITSGLGVFKWNGNTWSTITPPTAGNYSAVAVNPANSDQVVVSSSSFSPYVFNHYRSKDGGTTWELIGKIHDAKESPWYASGIGQATGTFCWDPFNPNRVWFTDFFFAYETDNIWADAKPGVTWKSRSPGHEESVTIGTLVCPPSGENLLLSSVADIGGWDHKSLTDPPVVGMMKFFPWTPAGGWGNLTGVAVQESNPKFIARVGRAGWDGPGYCGYSADGGATYTHWTSPKDAGGGRIAVSADSETMVWLSQQGSVYRSTDRGANWQEITSAPKNILLGGRNVFSTGPRFPLAADKVNGNKFYIYHYGKLYVSSDGGSTFAASANLGNSYPTDPLTVETTPGKEGDLWIGMSKGGLYHSTDSGKTAVKIPNVQSVLFMAIGQPAPTSLSVPAIYVFGEVNGIDKSLFRSNDNGATWTDLGQPMTGREPLAMAADRRVYGRVFFGTAGNGILVGGLNP